MDCNCLASAAPIENVFLVIRSALLPAGFVVMDGTWMTTESALTDSTIPVVIPHCASQPLLGGKILQSHAVGLPPAVPVVEDGGVVLTGGVVEVVEGGGDDSHPHRWQINMAAAKLRTNLFVFSMRSFPAVDLRIPTTRCI
jgi:hypothetical protein